MTQSVELAQPGHAPPSPSQAAAAGGGSKQLPLEDCKSPPTIDAAVQDQLKAKEDKSLLKSSQHQQQQQQQQQKQSTT